MTIVLEHQYWDLEVKEDRFSVTLSFKNRPERRVVPFESITAFADPAVKFADGLFEAFNSAAGSVMQAYGNLFQGRQTVSYTAGRHAMRAGFEARRQASDRHSQTAARRRDEPLAIPLAVPPQRGEQESRRRRRRTWTRRSRSWRIAGARPARYGGAPSLCGYEGAGCLRRRAPASDASLARIGDAINFSRRPPLLLAR